MSSQVYVLFAVFASLLVCLSCRKLLTSPEADIISTPSLHEQLKTAKVMLCTILKQEQLYVDEWLEYHRYLGYDFAELYDNSDEPSPYLAGLHEKYGNFVNVIHYPGSGMQRHAYRSCVKRYSDNNTWGSFIDVDEFVVLRNHNSIKEFLHDVAPDGGAVVLNWSVFGSNNTMKYHPGPVLARFIQTTPKADRHVKTTAYLAHVHDPNIHNCTMKPGFPITTQHKVLLNVSSFWVPFNDKEIANINHYNTKSLEEFMRKRHRGRASDTRQNAVYQSDTKEAHSKIIGEYYSFNNKDYSQVDTFARDFYLKHHYRIV